MIVTVGDEPRRLAAAGGAKVGITPGDTAATLAAPVGRPRDDDALRWRLAAASRTYACANLRERQTDRMRMLFEEVADRA